MSSTSDSAGFYGGPAAAELAEQIVVTVRDLALVTDPEAGSPGLRFPGDVYVTLGLLARALQELDPVLLASAQWLQGLLARGRLGEDSGERPDAAVHAAGAQLVTVRGQAHDLAEALRAVQTTLRGVHDKE
jgi:hypothetical protein